MRRWVQPQQCLQVCSRRGAIKSQIRQAIAGWGLSRVLLQEEVYGLSAEAGRWGGARKEEVSLIREVGGIKGQGGSWLQACAHNRASQPGKGGE